MISLYHSQITDILPGNIKCSTEAQAISYALQRQNQKLLDYANNINIVNQILVLPEEIIDLMAAELRTQYYSHDLDIGTKRILVSNTMIWYMRSGTTGAVEELVNAVYGYGNIEEWFDYGGEPFHFKITVDTLLSQEKLQKFSSIIKYAKNTRSQLDGFHKYNGLDNSVYYASGTVRTKYVRIGGK